MVIIINKIYVLTAFYMPIFQFDMAICKKKIEISESLEIRLKRFIINNLIISSTYIYIKVGKTFNKIAKSLKIF